MKPGGKDSSSHLLARHSRNNQYDTVKAALRWTTGPKDYLSHLPGRPLRNRQSDSNTLVNVSSVGPSFTEGVSSVAS